MSCCLDEVIRRAAEEEIALQHILCLNELLLCAFEVKVNIQGLDEFCDWVLVFVDFLLDDS